MNRWMIVMVAAFLIFGCGRGEPEQVNEIQAPETVAPVSRTIVGSFDGALDNIAAGNFARGIGLLLDITLLSGPEERLPAGFKEKIENARSAYAANQMATGGSFIREALALWNPGARESESVTNDPEAQPSAPVAAAFRERINIARDRLEQGDAGFAVTTILKALLLFSPVAPD